ncbi:unnamed protein product, partial [marine sediment metagenome]
DRKGHLGQGLAQTQNRAHQLPGHRATFFQKGHHSDMAPDQ